MKKTSNHLQALSIVPIFKQSIHIEHIDSPHPQKSSGDELHCPLLVPPFGGLGGSRSLGGLGGLKVPPYFGGLGGSRSLGGLGGLKIPPYFGGLAGSRSLGGLGGLKVPHFGGLGGSRSLGGLGGLKVPLNHLITLNSIVGLVHSTESGPTDDDGKYCSRYKGEGFGLAVLFVAALVVSVVSSSIGQSVGEDAVNLDAIGGVGVEVGSHSHDVRRV
eukprot:scaffold450_cov116-Skeletonema_dohrnii-CCMP3373.AAC.10